MRKHGNVHERFAGVRTGKLLADPVVWFAVNARLDGVDPGSESPVTRLTYIVYQRRLLLEALKNKAMLLALIDDKEKAAKTAQSYLEMAIPMSKLVKEQRDSKVERQMKEIEEMGPIHGAKAVDVMEMMRQEGERQAKARPVTASVLVKATHVQLTGAALADYLNKQETAKSVKHSVAPTRASSPLADRSLPRSRKPLP